MSDFTPQGDINLRDTYAIDGATNITALEFYGDGSNLTGIALDKALGDLTDVTITSVADNEFLIYDNASSKWINKTSTEIGFATVATSGLYSDLTGNPTIPDQLSDLSDDTTHRTVTDTEKSTWNGKQDTLVADTDYLTPGTAGTTYEPLKGIGDNYVTDADITLLGNTSNTNTGDQDIDGIGTNATAIALNTTHRTGDGSDHADVATNTSDIATNVIAIGLNTAKETNIVHPLVEKAVPSDALFTDTVYDDTTIQSEVDLNTTHRGLTNNPHSVDKTDVGLSNVPNTDCTNASNLSSGTVPSAVLPPVALTSVQTAVSEITMLALTTEEGDVVVRSDENKSYMRNAGTAGTMADFTELQTPTDSVLSVNGETGTVILTTGDISEDANKKYVTDAQLTIIGNTTNTNSGDQTISDATIALTDITTNDVSTAKHGFAPKGNGSATAFLNGLGAYSTPAGSGNVSTSGSPIDNDFAKFVNATDIEGRSYSEVRTDLNVEDGADVTDVTNVTAAGAAMSGGAFHDGFSDFVANEHLDWTADQSPAVINAANYTNTGDTTYTGGTNLTLDGTTFNVDDKFLKNDADDTTSGTITWSGGSSTNANTAYTHSQDNTQAHSDYLLNNASDTTSGTITAGGFTTTGVTVTGDHGTAATDQVVNVCYGTGSPPTANTTTIGSLFVKYTA